MYSLADLELWAKAVAGIVLLLGILAPFLNRLKGLTKVQFDYPGVFNTLAEFITLTAFLSVITYRHLLHLILPFWAWLVMGVLACIALLWIAEIAKDESSPRHVLFGGLLYTVSVGLIFFGIVHATAELVMYRPLHGGVVTEGNRRTRDIPVYLRVGSPTRVLESRTDGSGRYRFLLTKDEYLRADEVQVGKIGQDNTESLVLAGAEKCDATARTCYVPSIVLR